MPTVRHVPVGVFGGMGGNVEISTEGLGKFVSIYGKSIMLMVFTRKDEEFPWRFLSFW